MLFDGSSSAPISINNGVKQGCVLAPILFGISSPCHCLSPSMHQKMELFSPRVQTVSCSISPTSEPRTKSVSSCSSHTQEGLQRLINHLAHLCKEFGLTISLKKQTNNNNDNVMGQDVSKVLIISIGDYTREVVEDLTHLASTTSNNLSLEAEIGKPISKAASAVSRLSKKVWENNKLPTNTKTSVYNDCG